MKTKIIRVLRRALSGALIRALPAFLAALWVQHGSAGEAAEFWRASAGWWASDNTYLDGALQQKIPAYQSLVHIEVDNALITETSYRFYPAGDASRYYGEGKLGEDRGIELVTVMQMEVIDSNGTAVTIAVTPAATAQPPAMTTTPLAPTMALQRTVDPESGRENYHTVITMPTPDRRYTAMFGIRTGLENADVEAGDLRALALYAGRRIAASEVETLRAHFRATNRVGAVVTGDETGEATTEMLD